MNPMSGTLDSGAPEGFVPPRIDGGAKALPLATRKPLAVVGMVILAVYILLAAVGPFFVADPVATNPADALLPPSLEHLMGTDNFGRDVFARAVHSARLDLTLGVAIAICAMVIGSAIGVVAGYWGGAVDETLMRLTDIVLAFPGFVLALILVAVLGNSTLNVGIAVTAAFVPYFIRLTRAQALAERELEYVDGAKLAGNRSGRVAFFHVLPNSLEPSLVTATLVAGWAILTVSGLAFLGVGIKPPTAEWGVMVSEGARDIDAGHWWTSLFPGGMIVLACMAFHFIGDEFGGREV